MSQFIFKTVPFFVILSLLIILFASPAKANSPSPLKKATNLIAKFEGYSARCYEDPENHATIGYGRLLHFGPCRGKDLKLYWSQGYAKKMLRKDASSYLKNVQKLVKTSITQNMKAALTSFTYNIGVNGFKESTLLKKLNKDDFCGATRQFYRWVYGSSKNKIPGLVRRRKAEARLFVKSDSSRPSLYEHCLF